MIWHKVCEPYLDDILCYGQSFEEHLQNLEMVLRRLKTRGVKLRADKCHFFKPEIRYLGRLISKDGHRPDPRDTLVLEKYRSPKNNGELSSLLGFLGYYRPFVQDFAKKMKPLYNLLRQDASSKETTNLRKSRKDEKKKKKKGQQYNAKSLVNWNNKLQSILDTMIDYLRSLEVISYPDFNLPFFITCDACEGLGAVLYQKQNGVSRVKWAITEKFTDHLKYGRSFTVYTDNNPLTYFKGGNFRGFAVGPDREIFAFRGKKLSRSNDLRIFRGKKLSRTVDFREFAQINFYGIFNNQVILEYFAGKNFRGRPILEHFAGRNFREKGKKPRNRESFFLRKWK